MADNREMSTSHWWEDVKDLQVNLEYEKAIGDHFLMYKEFILIPVLIKSRLQGIAKASLLLQWIKWISVLQPTKRRGGWRMNLRVWDM